MSTYTIGEIAGRSGFSASALRYYEGIGLVEPATRTQAGYRLYDDDTLDRLAFIGRAKQLGCSLDEITDLVSIWDGQRCGPVQRRFHELVTLRLRDARHQVAELTAFTAELEIAAEQLDTEPVDGPCDAGCACLASPGSEHSPVVAAALCADPADVPVACSLEPGAMADRVADWQAVLTHTRQHTTTADGTLRVEFDDTVDLAELAALIAAEQRCCAFFAFALTVDGRGSALEVRAPDEAAAVVADLFGPQRVTDVA